MKEASICITCRYDLPKYEHDHIGKNKLEKTFWGRIKTEQCHAYLSLKSRNAAHNILHLLKYKNEPELGITMGKLFGAELLKQERFKEHIPEILIPVPLHSRKQAKRGYNQSQMIANGMQEVLKVPVLNDLIIRVHYNPSQTGKNRAERWKNSESVFQLTSKAKNYKRTHIGIVDDVITTGASLDALSQELLKIEEIKVSVFSLAFAD